MFELYKKDGESFILVESFQTIEECHSKAISEDIEFYSIEFRENALSKIIFVPKPEQPLVEE